MRFVVAVLPFCLAVPALAQGQDTIPPEVLELFPRGKESCYAAHAAPSGLKSGQTLTDLYLYRLFDPNPATESVEFSRAEAIAFDQLTGNGNWTAVMARFRDAKHPYTQIVSCSVWDGSSGRVTCGVDCDGGYFALVRGKDGIEFAFPPGSGGLSLNASCGEPGDDGPSRWMKPEEAGAIAKLQAASPAVCAEAEAQVRGAYAGDPVPLRERIEIRGWRCLKRVYDQRHLQKHPDQLVTAMAVAIKGPAKVERTAGEYNYTHLDVSISFRLRDGTLHQADSACGAMDYEIGCEGGFRLRRRDDRSALLAAGDFEPQNETEVSIMLGTRLGRDDRLFRLDASTATACTAD